MASDCEPAVGESDAPAPLAQSIRLPVAGSLGHALDVAGTSFLRRVPSALALLHAVGLAAQHDVYGAYRDDVAPAINIDRRSRS